MKLDRFDIGAFKKGYWIHITRKEAYRLISSLAKQMLINNINTYREEFTTEDNEYLTIGVIQIPESKKVIPKCETWGKVLKKFKTKKKGGK